MSDLFSRPLKENSHLNFMRQQLLFFILLFPVSITQVMADPDDLGRVLPLNDRVGNPKEDKQVAIFYFLWQGDENSEVSEIYRNLRETVPNHLKYCKISNSGVPRLKLSLK